MKLIFKLFTVVLILLSFQSNAQFKWPDGKKAAVVFTYDDGLDCHIDVAAKQLDEYGLKGTFYCTGNSPSLYNRIDEWRKMAQNGHELGNHTLFHPCNGKQFDWVKQEYDLNRYTIPQLLAELSTANTLLKAIDGKLERSFGFTCSNYVAGGIDFTSDIKNNFAAARCDGAMPETMPGYNTWKAPSLMVENPTAEEMIYYVNQARAKGTIAVFMFHSVGGGYLNVGAEEHRQLLEYVTKNSADFYTGTFLEVMKYIQQHR